MAKKMDFKKILGILICVLAVVAFALILIFSADKRGQKKLLDNYFTSVQRNSEKEFKKCISENSNLTFEKAQENIFNSPTPSGAVIKYKIISRSKKSNEIWLIDTEITAGTNEKNYKASQSFEVFKENGSWKIK